MRKTLLLLSFLAAAGLSHAQVPALGPIKGANSTCSKPAPPKTYSVTATGNPLFYTWMVIPMSSSVVISNPTSSLTQISFPQSNMTYTVYCTATNANGTSAPEELEVDVFETPVVSFSGSNYIYCQQGTPVYLQASPTIVSASSTLFYTWSPSTGLSHPFNSATFADPPSTTEYTVHLSIGSCTNTVKVKVTVMICNGINYLSPEKDIDFYPNPSYSHFTIRSEKDQAVRIYDQSGKCIRTLNVRAGTAVQIDELPPGMYLLRTERTTYKVIVDR